MRISTAFSQWGKDICTRSKSSERKTLQSRGRTPEPVNPYVLILKTLWLTGIYCPHAFSQAREDMAEDVFQRGGSLAHFSWHSTLERQTRKIYLHRTFPSYLWGFRGHFPSSEIRKKTWKKAVRQKSVTSVRNYWRKSGGWVSLSDPKHSLYLF